MSSLGKPKLLLVSAFAVTIFATALATALVTGVRDSRAQAAEPPGGSYAISSYFVGDAKMLTNGFVVVNQKNGKVANCVANWQGKREAKCHDWSTWVTLP